VNAAGISDTAWGMIHEDEFTKVCVLGSQGDLCVYEPTPDKEGLDRLVKLRGDFDPVGFQIKGVQERRKRDLVYAKFRLATFEESRYNFAAVLEVNHKTFALEEFGWVIGTKHLQRMAMRYRGRLVFQASADPASKDKYTPWRYRIAEIPGVIETAVRVLNERGRKAELPTRREEVAAARNALGLRR
jgi:hypothetical protein